MAEHVTEWLEAYHDGELGAAATRRIEAHLAECPACRAELEEIRRLSELLRDEIPFGDFISADRFAANLALSLPRRPAGPQPRTNGRIAWWALPVGLLALLLFINVTYTLGAALTIAADAGLIGSAGWLQGAPVQMDWFDSAMQLFGDRLAAPGWTVLSVLNDANVVIAQAARPLVLQALVAAAYLGWLLVWWLRGSAEKSVGEWVG